MSSLSQFRILEYISHKIGMTMGNLGFINRMMASYLMGGSFTQGSQEPALKQFPDFPWLFDAAFPWLKGIYFILKCRAQRGEKILATSGLTKKCIWNRVEIWFTSVRAKFLDFPWLLTKFPYFPEGNFFPWFSPMLGTLFTGKGDLKLGYRIDNYRLCEIRMLRYWTPEIGIFGISLPPPLLHP